tara:strand:- start:133 stop:330 length:198 start_codon:yes stop_codon:yes gene_type:complete
MKNDMGIHAMIGYMLEMKDNFSGFDSLSLTVEVDGKKLNIKNRYNQFSVSIKDNRAIHKENDELY